MFPTPTTEAPKVEGEAPKVEGEKPPEAPKVEPLTAESIKLPEGFTVNEPVMKDFLGVMNNAELTPVARAPARVDLQTKMMSEASDKASQDFINLRTEWQNAAKADKDFGGDNLAPTLATISKAIDKFGTPETRQIFDMTGAGDHPEIIRFIARLAKEARVEEAKPVVTQTSPAVARDPADILYPNQGKK
jgi:hypothetical protein